MPSRALARSVALALVGALALSGCASGDDLDAGPGATAPTTVAPSGGTSGPEVVVHTTAVPALHPSVDDYPTGRVVLTAPDGTEHRLAVRIADTTERRRHGLMEVPDVPPGTGMAFLMGGEQTNGFWMKGTLTPLDIAYVGANGDVLGVVEMVPCEDDPCPSYPPPGPYTVTLETRSRWLVDLGVGAGWTLEVALD